MARKANFRQADIRKLRDRVSGRCSNPKCRVHTLAPACGQKVSNIGKAAHICAASAGGPRFDNTMSDKERSSIDNAIWLCGNCHDMVDNDEAIFTVDVLKSWKAEAEKTSSRELGQKLPTDKDISDTLSMALGGFPKRYIATAVSNVHNAAETALERLDPRLKIVSEYVSGKNVIAIKAVEPVTFSMHFSGDAAREFSHQHRLLIDHGMTARIPIQGVRFSGSPLIEEISSMGRGTIEIGMEATPAVQKIWQVDPGTGRKEPFDDLHGAIIRGRKSIDFKGTACGGIFGWNYRVSISEGPQEVTINVTVNFSNWEGVEIGRLPYFEKLYLFFLRMASGWALHTALEIDGNIVFSNDEPVSAKQWRFGLEINNFLHYTNRSRRISQEFGRVVQFREDTSFTDEQHQNLAHVVDILEGNRTDSTSCVVKNARATILAEDDGRNIQELLAANGPIIVKLEDHQEKNIEVFGTCVNLPPKKFYLHGVIPTLVGTPHPIKTGDEVVVEFVPGEGFEYKASYK